jgi:hypothetical protein
MTTLSEAGALRRQQMRGTLMRAVVRRRRRRRAAVVAAGAALFGAAIWQWVGGGPTPSPQPDGRAPFAIAIAIEHDDPAIVARVRIEGDARVRRIEGDAELAAMLAGLPRAAGVGRIDGRLVFPGLVVDTWE